MEKIYAPKAKPKFKIKDHMKEFSKSVHIDGVPSFPVSEDDIQSLMNLDRKEFFSVMNSIDLEQISCSKDIPIETCDLTKSHCSRQFGGRATTIKIPKEALALNVIQARVDRSQNYHSRIDERTARYSKNKSLNPVKTGDDESIDLKPLEDIIISLHFYYPYKYEPDKSNFQIKFCQEFLVLGSQKLSVLRDKIYCSSQCGPFCEISENPTAERAPIEDNSAFFFITDTFYNDLSRPAAKDYSSNIIEWSKTIDDIDDLKVSSMDDAKFEDLTVRLGYPQLYQHYGNCEHIFVFSDVRLVQPIDVLQRSKYPFLKTIANVRCRICFICGVNRIKYLVRGCRKQITDPTYYCQMCFNTYLYVDGKKRCDFEVFPCEESRPT